MRTNSVPVPQAIKKPLADCNATRRIPIAASPKISAAGLIMALPKTRPMAKERERFACSSGASAGVRLSSGKGDASPR